MLFYTFRSENQDSLIIDFAPLLPPGTRILSCKLNRKNIPFTVAIAPAGTRVKFEFKYQGTELVEIEFREGISVLPVVQDPKPGYASEGLRIIEAGLKENVYSVLAENKAGTSGEISLWSNELDIDHIENGSVVSVNGRICSIQVIFPDEGRKYTQVPVKIYLK